MQEFDLYKNVMVIEEKGGTQAVSLHYLDSLQHNTPW